MSLDLIVCRRYASPSVLHTQANCNVTMFMESKSGSSGNAIRDIACLSLRLKVHLLMFLIEMHVRCEERQMKPYRYLTSNVAFAFGNYNVLKSRTHLAKT